MKIGARVTSSEMPRDSFYSIIEGTVQSGMVGPPLKFQEQKASGAILLMLVTARERQPVSQLPI
jgi:hypothetical protein